MATNSRTTADPRGAALKAFVTAVGLSAGLSWAALPGDVFVPHVGTVCLLTALAAFAGARPVRFPALRTRLVASQPFVFCALAILGPKAAVLVAVASVAGAAANRRPRVPLQIAFNLSAMIVTTATAVVTGLLRRPRSAVRPK